MQEIKEPIRNRHWMSELFQGNRDRTSNDRTRRKTEPRKTEHRIGPNIERPDIEKDWTSKDWTSNGTEHRKTECRKTEPQMGPNIERLNIEKDQTSKRIYNSVFSTMSQYLNKNYCNDRYTTVVGKLLLKSSWVTLLQLLEKLTRYY